MANREDVLGFTPQKESAYSKLLPYADVIDEESNNVFAEIKENLAKAVQFRDIKTGASHWTVQLAKYLRLYGFKMSKEDHLLFVHLMFELSVTPKMELSLVQKFSGTLCALLKKEELLSRDDLVLPWRPLFDLMEDTIYSSMEQHGLQLLPANIDHTLKSLVRACRVYFSDESTQEMLEEWRPLLCPFDVTVMRGLSYYELFLPTSLPPEKHHMGFKLWFQEVLDLWYSFLNCPSWEASIVSLFSRLANETIGHIDWKLHIPTIFTRVLRSFNLPVGTHHINYSRGNNCYETNAVTTWISAMLGDGTCLLEHIQKLFRALHSFFHPSNTGRWSLRLSSFLQTLPFMVVRRLHRERFRKPSWHTPVPESHRLTDADITQFVEILKPAVFTAMFGKGMSQDAAIRNLSLLRPEIIIPPLLEKMYPAMETLIEPHRLLSCMFCVVSSARPMLSSHKYYPDGRNHVIPLLQLALPGIDPNDFKKTLVTLQMVSTYAALVPIVDCSEATQVRSDLTEHEQELCSATAQFEDFVLEFLNRIISMIETSAQEATFGALDRLTAEQSMLEVGLASTVTSVLQQCSKPIFMSALHKINRFVMENVYEVKVSGRLAANLCRAAARVRPEETLKLLLPRLCEKIQAFAAEHPDIAKEEHLDNSFLWNMLMLSQLLRCNGAQLVPYKDTLLSTLGPMQSLHSPQGYEIAGQVLRFMLRALTLTYPLEFRSVTQDIDQPLKDYLPIRDWAIPGDMDNLDVKWHVPNEEERQFATTIAETVIQPHLDFILGLTQSVTVEKEDLQRRLHLIIEFILGSGSLLPAWEGEEVQLKDSMVPLGRFCCKTHKEPIEITMQGRNVRATIADTMRHLLKYMTESREDDTKSMFKIIQIYETVMMFYGTQKADVDARWKSFRVVKAALQNLLNHQKKHIRPLLVDRIQLLHELRSLSATPRHVTAKHLDLINDLMNLSVSRYREVRKRAQGCLQGCFAHFHYTYLSAVQPLVTNLKNPHVEEHTFKGSLHIILGSGGKRSMATRRNWEVLSELWPAICQAQHFEKPSILRIVDEIITKVVKAQETVAIKNELSKSSLDVANQMMTSGSTPKVPGSPLSAEELSRGENVETEKNDTNLRLYTKLVVELVALIESGKLTWKFSQNAMEFLALLIRDDTPFPTVAVQLFTKHCVSDMLYNRKLCLAAVSAILQQQKRRKTKVEVDIAAVSGTKPCLPSDPLAPGDRVDNRWHQYDSSNLPTSSAQWDACTFVPKTHLGYYCWPKKLMNYADESQQPKLIRSVSELAENEVPLYENFSQPEFVAKLLHFLALEEQKGRDKFQLKHLTLFKGLFRNFGDTFLEVFKPHLERLAKDTSHNHHDSSQRCAMEVLSGLIRGSKHWPYEKIEKLWEWLLPLLSFVLGNITIETQDDWGTFFTSLSESRDPRQMHWLFELLMKNPINAEGGAFGDASRLLMLQHALVQQEWRVPDLLNRLLVEIQPHLDHPYKAVRDQLGSILSNVFLYDYRINAHSETRSPLCAEFLTTILAKLDRLKDAELEKGDNQDSTMDAAEPIVKASNRGDEPTPMETEDGEEGENKQLILLCKTVMKWLHHSCLRCFGILTKEVFPIVPVICNLLSVLHDEDLNACCKATLTNLSAQLLTPDVLPHALHTIKEVTGLQSWRARVAILHFLQISVFGNFFLLQNSESKLAIQELLLHLLCDERLEVREVAAMTLSGMMHCGFLEMNTDMMNHFERLRRVKLKKRHAATEPDSLEKLIKRHAGVLGLSACVQAHPYDVPDFIPQVLMDLSVHVNDPQPIQMTVKKTLSDFRRTHHDNWHDHKQMFTDDQLVVLTDLLISPNYYA